jgi:predicted transcriptional regulator
MVELTGEQRKVIFQLGRTDSVFESVSEHIIKQLVQMGLLYYRSENNICFTDEGERIYQQLKKLESLA